VVLRRENVARRPRYLRAQRGKGLDEHGRLDGHVQAAGNARALEGLRRAEFLAQAHQTGHFSLGEADFLTAPGRQLHVLYFVRNVRFRRGFHHDID